MKKSIAKVCWFNTMKGYGYAALENGTLIFLSIEASNYRSKNKKINKPIDMKLLPKRYDILEIEYYAADDAFSFIKQGDLIAYKFSIKKDNHVR